MGIVFLLLGLESMFIGNLTHLPIAIICIYLSYKIYKEKRQ